MNYISTYGLKRNPFINTKLQDGYITADVVEFNHRLQYIKQVKGLGIVYGDQGTGKTFTIRGFIHSLATVHYNPVYISQTSVGRYELYKQIALELEIPIVCSIIDLFLAIQKKIKNLSVNHQITTVLVIDEANRLSADIMDDLELLLNWDIDASRYCILILCGKKELIQMLPDSLADRVIMKHNTTGITHSEVKEHVQSLLLKAGCNKIQCTQIFDEAAINALAQCCGNNIRKLNMLIDKCLFFGSNKNLEQINSELVMTVFNEVTIK